MEEEEQVGCLRKEKSSGMAGAERWRKKKKKKKRMKEEGKQRKGKKIATRLKNKEIEPLRLDF